MAEPAVATWLIFQDASLFTHYLTGAAAADPSVLDRPWTVLELDSGDGEPPVLAVGAGRRKDKLEVPRRLQGRIPLVKASVDQDSSVFTVVEGPGKLEGRRFAIIGKERPYPNAIQAVPLVRWESEPRDEVEVVFRVPSREKLVSLVKDHISIDNNQLSVAGLKNEDGSRSFLVKARRPSRFIIYGIQQRRDDIPVFWRASNRAIYLEWGWTHPLVRWMNDPGEDAMVFADARGEWRQFKGGTWKDVGDLLEFGIEPASLKSVESRMRLKVQLKLEGRPSPLQPEFWLLKDDRDDRARLERLMVQLSDEDRRTLEFSYIEAELPGADAAQRFIVVRERITGAIPKWVRDELSAGDTPSYAAVKGLQPPLMLPVASVLSPELKLERYAKAFALKPGEVTVLDEIPDAEGGHGTILAVKLEDRFVPFDRFVDLVVDQAAERVRATLVAATFDLAGFMYDLSAPPATKKNPGSAKEWVEEGE